MKEIIIVLICSLFIGYFIYLKETGGITFTAPVVNHVSVPVNSRENGVKEIVLNDGTRCVVYSEWKDRKGAGGIDCDWTSQPH